MTILERNQDTASGKFTGEALNLDKNHSMAASEACCSASQDNGYVRQEPYTYCIFQESWWLDAIVPGAWDAIEVGSNGQVDARHTYHVVCRAGVKAITMPLLASYMGPWVREASDKLTVQTKFTQDALDEVIPKLPKVSYFDQSFHPRMSYWLPFYRAGYEGHSQQNHAIIGPQNYSTVFKRFGTNRRRFIRLAGKNLELDTNPDDNTVMDMVDKTYPAKGLRLLNRDYVSRIFEACKRRGRLLKWVARDEDGNVHAANAAIRDDHTVYGLISGFDRQFPKSNASEFLMSEMIRYACDNGLSFDFSGSVVKSIEFRNLSLGATPIHFLSVRRASLGGKVLYAARKHFLNATRNFLE
ncbi:MAG: GNAT family N-acetyltransferase [Boseongicola sp.]